MVIADYIDALRTAPEKRRTIEQRLAALEQRLQFDLTRFYFGDDLDLLIMDIERHTEGRA